MNIIESILDKNLFGSLFKDLNSWKSWIVTLKTIFGLPMTEEELNLYFRCTGRQRPPQKPFKEVYLVVGRRGGKSFITSIIAVFLAIFRDYSKYLSPGERGTIMIIATDRKQAQIILRYIKSILSLPIFKTYVEREIAEAIELTNRINIEVHTASYKAVRGYTVISAILEEIAFWSVEGANPDREIYTAIKPAMATIPDSMLISISTPYSRQGLLYEKFKEFYGTDDDEVLVWKAPSIVMNPTLSERTIQKQMEKDFSAGKAEWLAEFREDLEAFLPLETIEAVVIPGRVELPPIERTRYFAFVDPSGGGGDSFTLSIGHKEGTKIVQDVIKSRKGDPHEIVKEYSEILKKYSIFEVTGDKYAGSWVSEAFREQGITYRASELNKSDLYLEALPYFNLSFVELLDDREMIKQFRILERRRGASGKDIVDHPKIGNAHDDSANVTAGLIVLLTRNKQWVPEFKTSRESRLSTSPEMKRFVGFGSIEDY
jgi:hypothetical protein